MDNTSLPLEHALLVDVDRVSGRRPVLLCHRGDRCAHKLCITLTSGEDRVILPDDATVTLYATRSDGTSVFAPCTVSGDGTVSHVFTSSEISVPGDMDCELYIVTQDCEMTTPTFRVSVDGIIRDDGTLEADNDFSALGELISEAENLSLSMEGTTISLTGKNGDTASVSFTDNGDGSMTVDFSDTSGETASIDVSGRGSVPVIPATENILIGDGAGGFADSEIGLGHFLTAHGHLDYIMTCDGFTCSANTYMVKESVGSDEGSNTRLPTEKAVRTAINGSSSFITLTDDGDHFTNKTVEGALQELGASLDGVDEALAGVLTLIGGDE